MAILAEFRASSRSQHVIGAAVGISVFTVADNSTTNHGPFSAAHAEIAAKCLSNVVLLDHAD